MKTLVVLSLIALSFATGFTCSKNAPEAAKTEAPAQQNQEQMAQPAAAPAEGAAAPAAGTEAAPAAAPAEGAAAPTAQPETK